MYKQKELKQYLKENHIKVAALLEIRVKENKAQRIASKVAHNQENFLTTKKQKREKYGWSGIKNVCYSTG